MVPSSAARPPPASAVARDTTHHGSQHPALAEAAIARGDPPILRSVVTTATPLAEAVARAAGVSAAAAVALLRLGAVYLGERPNGPLGPLKWRRQRGPRAARRRAGEGDDDDVRRRPCAAVAAAGGGAPCSGEEEQEAEEAWWRRSVGKGTPLRVHSQPKRFTRACAAVRLLEEDADYVVICKPGGLPSMAHESNDAEHAAACAEAAWSERRRRRRRAEEHTEEGAEDAGDDDGATSSAIQLQLCHRLDTWTSGVLVLARHPAAAARFSEALRGGRDSNGSGGGNGGGGGGAFSEKTYLALTRGKPAAAGGPPLVAHMYDGPWGDSVSAAGGMPLGARGPRILAAADPHSGGGGGGGGGGNGGGGGAGTKLGRSWKRCELVVESAEPATERACAWADAAERRAAAEMAAAAIAAGQGGAEEPSAAASSSPVSAAASAWHLCTVSLVTGRTHQIRAQLAAAGHPIAGDSMYAPLSGVLACAKEGSVLAAGGGLSAVRRAAAAQVAGVVGLHAWRLQWRAGGEGGQQRVREYVARPPWEDGPEEGEEDEDGDDDRAAGAGAAAAGEEACC